MDNRENVLRALRRDGPERVPFDFFLCPYHIDALEKKTGTRDYHKYFNFPFRYIELNATRKKGDYTKYYKELPEDASPITWNPEWGIYGKNSGFAHFQHMLHPLENAKSIKEIEDYPFPDFDESYRWDGMEDKISEIVENDLIAVAFMQMTIFEISWYLRGMDTFMLDMLQDTHFAEVLLDKVTDIRIGMAQKYAKHGADILMLGDDVSTQIDMMISPELWRRMLKPRLKKVVQEAKIANPGILIFYHGDGNIQAIIPDLIEIGVDILNPIQPECMDPLELKKTYGNHLSFWGTIGTQTTLPFGSPKDVKEMCAKNIKEIGKRGGLLLAPTHMIEPDVPWENVEAFIEAVEEYGYY